MKQLMLILVVALQTMFVSTAAAWSPMDGIEKATEFVHNCYFAAAGSEQDQDGGSSEEEEEEPDCE